MRDRELLDDLLCGVDIVCHQAAMVGSGLDPADLPLFAAHNDLGTATLLAAMFAAGVRRLVLASSMVVYGEGRYVCAREAKDVVPTSRDPVALAAGRFDPACPGCGAALDWAFVDEDARLAPRSGYAASKVSQEHFAAAWATQASGSVVALRYHNVYGPRMPRDTPYAGVASLWRSALARGQAPEVFEDGGQIRDFVHVTDVAEANLKAVDALAEPDRVSPAIHSRFDAYNVCSGRPVAIGQVAQWLGDAAGGPPPRVTGKCRPFDVRHVVADPARAATDLGFVAAVAPEDGIAAFAREPQRESVSAVS